MANLPICEYLDVDGTHVTIAVRLRGYDAPVGERIRIRLLTRTGRVVIDESVVLTDRVNTVGVRTRSAATVRFDAADLGSGSFRLRVHHRGRESDVDPSAGLLASSRPQRLGERRVQVLPGVRKSTWLRIGSMTSAGRALWALAGIGRDIVFAGHLRRFTWVRYLRALTTPWAPRGEIWLVGERAETARDNGWAFFRYVRREFPKAPVYYVIRWEHARRLRLEDENLIAHSSLRHRLLMLHADVLINAYSIKHMLPRTWHPGAYMKQAAWRLGARRVYLKHGVHLSPDAVKRANGGYDLVCTVGPGETEGLAENSGYGKELVETGLARYDSLVRSRDESRSILFMPTWRRYLVPTLFSSGGRAKVEYEGSTYQRFIDEFIGSEKLLRALTEHDLFLEVVPHHNLAEFLNGRSVGSRAERIRVHDPLTADIPGLIRGCAMMCTDYSSVHFDAAYLGIPLVYVQVDQEEFRAGHSAPSWFDFDTDGFGPVTTTVDGAIAEIERYAASGFARESVYEERVAKIFTHDDRSNSARIVRAITGLK